MDILWHACCIKELPAEIGLNMSKVDEAEMRKVAYQIEQYLISHPYAADAVEGVSVWWLLGTERCISNEMVQRALDFLCEQKVLKCNANIGGSQIYSRY